MPSSNSIEPTPLNLCVIIDRWLQEHDYKLLVRHSPERCAIAAVEQANNLIDVGYISDTYVLLLGDDFNSITIEAHDLMFFELLEKGLSFAKP